MGTRFLRAVDKMFDLIARLPKLTWGLWMILMGCGMAVLALLSTYDPTPVTPSPSDTLVIPMPWLIPALLSLSLIIQGASELVPENRPRISRALRTANLGMSVVFLLLIVALIRSCTVS